MNMLSKLQPVWILTAAAAGILLGQNSLIAANAAGLIEIFLMTLLFFVFLGVELREITQSFANIRFSTTALLINFVWTPVFAFVLGRLFLQGHIDLQVGFLMLMVTPCTDWYLIFTGMSGGNVPLGSSILPMNLILQVLLLPFYLWLFMGSSVAFAPSQMIAGIVLVLVAPLALAGGVKWLAGRNRGAERFARFAGEHGDGLQLLFLCFAVAAMFASQGRLMLENLGLFVRLLLPLTVFFAVNFALALAVGGRLRMPFADRIALLFTTSARNSPVSLAIATITFPHRPMILLALVIGPLIELPVLALDAALLKRIGAKHTDR